jgi:hypothetical protein
MFVFAKPALELGASLPLVVAIDRILLVSTVIEILHTVRVSFNPGALVYEPFFVVGWTASIFASAGAQENGPLTIGSIQFIDDRALCFGRIDSRDGLVNLPLAPQQQSDAKPGCLI